MKAVSRRQMAIYSVDQLLAGSSPAKIAARLAAELYQTRRSGQIEMLIGDIYKELENRQLLCRAEVGTARPLSKPSKKAVMEFIAKLSGTKKVEISENVDAKRIGGVEVKTAVWQWDATLKTKLNMLSTNVNRRQGVEIV